MHASQSGVNIVSCRTRNIAIHPNGASGMEKFQAWGVSFHKDIILYSLGMLGQNAWCSSAINLCLYGWKELFCTLYESKKAGNIWESWLAAPELARGSHWWYGASKIGHFSRLFICQLQYPLYCCRISKRSEISQVIDSLTVAAGLPRALGHLLVLLCTN